LVPQQVHELTMEPVPTVQGVSWLVHFQSPTGVYLEYQPSGGAV
jgi:hypothetical protein